MLIIMNPTITKSAKRTAQIAIKAGPLLAQVTAPLGSRRYLAGKQAYDFLGSVLEEPVTEVMRQMRYLGLASISKRDLSDPTEASLAVAAAAVLDGSRGVRATVTEQVERAMAYLDDELAAGW